MPVYFAQLPTGAIKIGHAVDVVPLHITPGDRQTEREIHRRFAHLRFGRADGKAHTIRAEEIARVEYLEEAEL